MSSSKVISGDELTTTAYQRWELPNMQSPHGAKARVEEVAEATVQPLTAEQLEQIQQEAYREGFELGKKEGRDAGQQEIKKAVANLGRVIDAFSNPLQEVDARVEQELVALALAVARQIIRRELKTDPGQVIAVVREALAALPSASRRVQIALHRFVDRACARGVLDVARQGQVEGMGLRDFCIRLTCLGQDR